MSPHQIIRRLVETLILPNYPALEIDNIDSYSLVGRKIYGVYFKVKKKLPLELHEKIDTEIKTLFKMAGLEEVEQEGHWESKIQSWFKTPREKGWRFHSGPSYEH